MGKQVVDVEEDQCDMVKVGTPGMDHIVGNGVLDESKVSVDQNQANADVVAMQEGFTWDRQPVKDH